MSTIICRVGYCLPCAKLNRPRKGHTFLGFGSTGGYKDLKAYRDGLPGFTPHIYKLLKTQGIHVIVDVVCAMNGCGVFSVIEPDGSPMVKVDPSKWRREKFRFSEWNSIVMFKHDSVYSI